MSTIPGFAPLGNLAPPQPGLPDQADFNPLLTRTHYFDGRLLTAADLTREQLYLDQRLREVGRGLGAGVVRGLEVALVGGRISIEPGLAITAAGRVLEVRAPLPVDVNDRARIALQNDGRFANLPHGLFALLLAYAERPQGVAEVFPRDLAERTTRHDVDEEGVQAWLWSLPVPLPATGQFTLRAGLMRLAVQGALDAFGLPEDAVALGVLAISDNAPRWLDQTLLRHAPRRFPGPADRQADLKRQYEALLADVLAARLPLAGDFAATDYFRVLPPTGRAPKAAFDPVTGRQRFFPEHFLVSVAPIRQADLDLVQQESLRLPPIDLARDEPVDLVVLAPLPDQTFGRLTAGLLREPPADPALAPAAPPVRLPRLDLLALRLYPQPPVHARDTDGPDWGVLWDAVDADALVFVRRPTRAAETGISAIRIATGAPVAPLVDGAAPPDAPADALPAPGDTANLLLDEDALLLRRVGFARLAALRAPTDAEGEAALAELRADFGAEARVALAALELLALIERRFDPVLWPTLLATARAGTLARLRDALVERREAEAAVRATAIADGNAPPAPAGTAALIDELAADPTLSVALPDALRLRWQALGDPA
jgi:hypothetical protein